MNKNTGLGLNEQIKAAPTRSEVLALRGVPQVMASERTLRKRARIVKERLKYFGEQPPAEQNIQTLPKEDRRMHAEPGSSGRAQRRRSRRSGGSAAQPSADWTPSPQ